MFKKLKLLTLSLFLLGFSYMPAFAIDPNFSTGTEPEEYVQVRAIAEQNKVSGGETIRIGLEQTIYPGWHTYWKNPGDSGTPTGVTWTLPEGFAVSELEWPTANKIPFGPLTNYGYEGQTILLQNLTLPTDIGDEPFALNGKVDLLVCHDICIPETHDIFLVFNGSDMAEPQRIIAAENKLPLSFDWPSNFSAQGDQFTVTTKLEDSSLLEGAQNITFLPEEWGAVDNTAEANLTRSENGFTITQQLGGRDLSEISILPFVLSYTDVMGEAKSIHITATPAPIAVPTSTDNAGSTITIFSAILFALLGGIILNLMPCVFPVLSMKALSLVNLQGKEEAKARGYGLFYTAGILVSFAAIGGILLLLKSGGAQIGWGFQLQNPVVILTLAYLVFVIGLNLAGLFEFSGRLGKIGTLTQKLSDKDGHRGAFFTGVLATLVATPCTAPFMGAALGFALTQPAIISMIVFLTLGLGLALPYLALCFIPALRSKLPKPGAWMLTFRQFLSFPMFLTAVWLIWVLAQQAGSIGVLMGLSGMVFIALISWLVKVMPASGKLRLFSVALLGLSALFIFYTFTVSNSMTHIETAEENEAQNWSNFTPAKLETLLASDAPVFTNMTAAWCITCKVNEKIALKTETVTILFANKGIEYLKGDWTNQDSDITHYLNNFGRQGVPLYVYYGPRDAKTGMRPEPVVLPQLLTAGIVEEIILK